jgi:DNA polymerase elongation subunit (family B)
LIKKRAARVLFVDIETAPLKGYTWGIWEQNVIEVSDDWYMLSFAAKWGDGKIQCKALPDYPGYKKNRACDKALVTDLWKLMNEADVVVAHNGDAFDIKKANARFIKHGLPPVSPFKSIDTLKIARKHFKFDSNKLDSLGAYLGVGRKLPHTGKHLWLACMAGDEKAWRLMRRYNKQDVALLWRVYMKIRSWAANHPDLRIYSGSDGCPTCQSTNVYRNGKSYAMKTIRQRYHCRDCGKFYPGEAISG